MEQLHLFILYVGKGDLRVTVKRTAPQWQFALCVLGSWAGSVSGTRCLDVSGVGSDIFWNVIVFLGVIDRC